MLRVLDACIDWRELEADSDHRTTLARYAISQRLGYPRFVSVGREWRRIKDTGMMVSGSEGVQQGCWALSIRLTNLCGRVGKWGFSCQRP